MDGQGMEHGSDDCGRGRYDCGRDQEEPGQNIEDESYDGRELDHKEEIHCKDISVYVAGEFWAMVSRWEFS